MKPPLLLSEYNYMTFKYSRDQNGHCICPHCGITKPETSTMSMHRRVCEGDLPHECTECEYKCLSKQRLTLHIASKHPQTAEAKRVPLIKCPVADCTFHTLSNGNRLIHFMRKHCVREVSTILQETDNTFNCRRCARVFQSNTAFQYHAAHCITMTDTVLSGHLRTVLA